MKRYYSFSMEKHVGSEVELEHRIVFYEHRVISQGEALKGACLFDYFAPIKDVLLVWGVYRVEKDSIWVEYLQPSSGGPAKSVIYSGIITSDTSFVLTNFFNHYDYKNRVVDQHYQFHKLEQKPDSTNNFIK